MVALAEKLNTQQRDSEKTARWKAIFEVLLQAAKLQILI